VVLNEFTRGKIVVRFGQWILLPIYILSNISFDPKSNYGGFLRYSIFRKLKKKCLKVLLLCSQKYKLSFLEHLLKLSNIAEGPPNLLAPLRMLRNPTKSKKNHINTAVI